MSLRNGERRVTLNEKTGPAASVEEGHDTCNCGSQENLATIRFAKPIDAGGVACGAPCSRHGVSDGEAREFFQKKKNQQ